MSFTASVPLVLLPACRRNIEDRDFQAVPEAYAEAVRLAGCLPVTVTAEGPEELATLLDWADGILLPGSPSNVHPSHYGEELFDLTAPLDSRRDVFTLPLIRQAVKRGIPLLGICRGHQEFNVALGGSLHQAVHRLPGHDNHQPYADACADEKFGPVHDVEITPGGLLEGLLGPGRVRVSSVHGQAINRLAPGLRVEARSPDGVIEAVTLPTAPGFNLGVQWHPEWKAQGNPVSEAIFRAYGAACQAYRRQRVSLRQKEA